MHGTTNIKFSNYISCPVSFYHIHVAQSLYYPTNAHNVKNVELLKHIKIMEAAPTRFGLQRKPSSGSHSQCLAKITRLVQC